MFTIVRTLNMLFAQLGLADDDRSIQEFVESHRPLAANVPLSQAPWWSTSQAAFLEEAIHHDSDWADLADKLDAMLR